MTSQVCSAIVRDDWLTSVFEHDVFRVEAPLDGRAPASKPWLGDVVCAHARSARAALYYVKVPAAAARLMHGLEAAGFRVVDTNVVYTLNAAESALRGEAAVPPSSNGVHVAPIEPPQEEAVLDIAGSCFRYSRFHLDPLVPLTMAHKVKRAWVMNYVRRARGEALLVASRDGHPAGFLAVLAGSAGERRVYTIDLIGVAEAHQRQGVGLALTRAFVAKYRDRGDALQVGTQIANTPSIRLYEQLGFRLSDARYVMHLHVRDGKPVAAA